MRHHIEKLVCGAFATGAFAMMLGLLATTTAQGDTGFDVESPSDDREATFVAFVPDGAPDGVKEQRSITEQPERSETSSSGGPSTARRSSTRELASSEAGTVVAMSPRGQMVKGESAAKREKKGRTCVEPSGYIESTGTNTYDVDKALIDTYVDDLDAASRLAWTAWHSGSDGEVDGFSVRRIRCGSPLHEAGFRNGDVVHSVNGREIQSIPDAMRAYRKVKRKDTLKVDLTRKDGSSRELRFDLQ